jgi:hypothetical protein
MSIIDWMIEYLPLAILIAAFVNPMTGEERNPNSPAEGDRYIDGNK